MAAHPAIKHHIENIAKNASADESGTSPEPRRKVRPRAHPTFGIDWFLLSIRFKLRDHSGKRQLVIVLQSPGKDISPIPANGQVSPRCRCHNYSGIVLKFDSRGKYGWCV